MSIETSRLGAFTARSGALGAVMLLVLSVSTAAAARGDIGPVTACSTTYVENNPLLGPDALPNVGSFAPLFEGYDQLSGLSGRVFLTYFYDPKAMYMRKPSPDWIYPPDHGFLIVKGKAEEKSGEIRAGTEVDRFGPTRGSFLSFAGTPYAKRSLPPNSLDPPMGGTICNYHRYRVRIAFRAEVGPIAPAFGQPGLGEQIFLDPKLVPFHKTDKFPKLSVAWMLDEEYLTAEAATP